MARPERIELPIPSFPNTLSPRSRSGVLRRDAPASHFDHRDFALAGLIRFPVGIEWRARRGSNSPSLPFRTRHLLALARACFGAMLPHRILIIGFSPSPGSFDSRWESNGAPGEDRTPDPKFRKLVLYPTELRARGKPS
jgi:hypothetical protein